jgi:4-amino-4-deoxy-L-arabinose transferase-like glycosyltransferase
MNKKIFLIILSSFFIQLTWSLVVLPLEFPDEQAHLASVQYFTSEDKMPTGSGDDLSEELLQTENLLGTYRDELGNNKYTYHSEYHPEYSDSLFGINELAISELNSDSNSSSYVWREAARYPPLYYAYSSIFYRIAKNRDIISRLFLVRVGSIFLSTTLIYFAYLIGKEVFPKKSNLPTVLAITTSLHPMLTFVGSGVNSDNLFNLLFTMLIYLSLRVINAGWSARLANTIGIVAGLTFLTKTQGYLFVPILLIALVLRLRMDKNIRSHFSALMRVIVIIALVAGWQEFPKIFSLLSSGTLPGAELITTTTSNPPTLIAFAKFSFHKLNSQNIVWYWGVFKWLGIVLPSIYWQLSNRLVLVSIIGISVIYLKKIKHKRFSELTIPTFLILSLIVYVMGIFLYDYQFARVLGYSLGVQARYYYPLIVSQLALVILGITSFTDNRVIKNILAILIGLIFVWLQLGGMHTLVNSYYDLTSIPTLLTQLSQYKPLLVKGSWWYLWISTYFASVIILAKSLFSKNKSQS